MKPIDYPLEPSHLWEHLYQLTQTLCPSKEMALVETAPPLWALRPKLIEQME